MNERRRQRGRRLLVEAALLLALLAGFGYWQTRDLPSGEAPALRGRLLDGGAFDLADLRGRPVLVHFWGTWCPVCRLESGTIAALARRHAVIGVAVREGAEDVEAYFRKEGLRFPVLADPEGRLQSAWRVRAVPASFILDREGQIRFRSVGYTTRPGLEIRLWLADLLSAGS